MGDANLNVLWSRAIAEELVRGGVEHAVICPGSRSSPLALAFAAQEGLRCWSVIDERSAAFVALGIAKATGVPAAVVVTSGTAGAHFHPAVIEAAMSGVPLVAITADRPGELQGFGAPQTIPQAHLFGDFAVHFADLGVPEASTPVLLHLRATVARAVSRSMTQPRGAVHLNVPLREPLAPVPVPFGAESLTGLAREGREGQPFTRFVSAQQAVDPQALQRLREQVATVERGVILCGPRDADDGLAEALLQLSRATGYPILAEATSQVRFGAGAAVVAHYDALLRHEGFATAHAPELVLRFGGGLTPKLLQRWIDGAAGSQVLFTEGGRVSDPAHAAAQVLEGSPVEACLQLAAGLARGPTAWTRAFADAEQLAVAVIEAALDEAAVLNEPEVARVLARAMPPGANLFVSSSMPIRALDAFAAPGSVRFHAHASRGVNGIDGILSTALGIAMGRARPTVVLTGDVAFLHDVGGLLTAARERVSLTVLVVNNDGGGIFSFLPIAEVGSPAFEPFIATPHGVDLSHAAALYGARFHRPTEPAGLAQALAAGLEGGLHVIEVRLDRAANVEVHRGLYRRVADALAGGAKP